MTASTLAHNAFGIFKHTSPKPSRTHRTHGLPMPLAVAMFATSLVIGSCNGILASAVSLPSVQIVMVRALLATVILAAVYAASRTRPTLLQHKREALMLVLAGAIQAGDWLFLFESYREAGVGLATILRYCAPVLVMLLSPIIFRERLTPLKIAGFGVVASGAVLVNGLAIQGGSVYGIACGLASAGCYSVVTILNKKVTHITGIQKVLIEVSAATVVVVAYGLISVGALPVIQHSDIAPLLGLGLCSALGNILYLRAMDSLSVQNVAVLSYVEPLSALGLGILILGETLAPIQAVGAACIVGGALLCQIRTRKRLAAGNPHKRVALAQGHAC